MDAMDNLVNCLESLPETHAFHEEREAAEGLRMDNKPIASSDPFNDVNHHEPLDDILSQSAASQKSRVLLRHYSTNSSVQKQPFSPELNQRNGVQLPIISILPEQETSRNVSNRSLRSLDIELGEDIHCQSIVDYQ